MCRALQRLSERLASSGNEGAEQLVDTINACFSALLADASASGGSLLKFGGDALLLWFEGEQHALRACSSAVAMRRTLRDVGRIRAGAGNVVLRMSVGVHSGSYAMFLVGGSHRELLIGGPATSTVVAMENIASAGQILVSADTARLLPRGCLGAEAGSGVLLARTPRPSIGFRRMGSRRHPSGRLPIASRPSSAHICSAGTPRRSTGPPRSRFSSSEGSIG